MSSNRKEVFLFFMKNRVIIKLLINLRIWSSAAKRVF